MTFQSDAKEEGRREAKFYFSRVSTTFNLRSWKIREREDKKPRNERETKIKQTEFKTRKRQKIKKFQYPQRENVGLALNVDLFSILSLRTRPLICFIPTRRCSVYFATFCKRSPSEFTRARQATVALANNSRTAVSLSPPPPIVISSVRRFTNVSSQQESRRREPAIRRYLIAFRARCTQEFLTRGSTPT